jgi:hypothetical protein
MLELYSDVRADGCDLEQDGDMLLYQWGTYAWDLERAKPELEVDFARQLCLRVERRYESAEQAVASQLLLGMITGIASRPFLR